jgi:bifunctional non-homologous end joining protein LigD
MSGLDKYNEKRTFEDTPEPEGREMESEEKNRFVIQKHMARREHYDFRLQVNNVLVSWAIPKKPVHDPDVKRLAIKVEDHPLSYIHFEGNIPKGNYGAGTVMVWDVGYYYLDDEKAFPATNIMMEKLEKGSLKLYLQGAKLKGYFNLVKAHGSKGDEWFFMKAKTTDDDIDYESRSALSGKTMDEITASETIWGPDQETRGNQKESIPPKAGKTTKKMKEGKQKYPGFVLPMLASLTDKPFSKSNWIYELKLDGYRVIAGKASEKAELFSRRGNDYSKKYHLIAGEISTLNARFVLDGEVCYMDKNNHADFQKLQHDDHEQDNLHYYVFDILWLNGHDLKHLALSERKQLLKILLKTPPAHIHYLDHVEKEGEKFFTEVEKKGLEGIIAKRSESIYTPGDRSKDWFKIKTGHRQEMIICGYMPSDKPGRHFRSLLCAVYKNGSLVYTGRVGTGFNEKMQDEIFKELKPLETDSIEIENPPSERGIQWVKPRLIGEVKFANFTEGQVMRHASFVGLRSDKKPQQVTMEKPVKAPQVSSKVTFTNLKKVFWPEEKITKKDVIDYYRDLSEIILPYLKDRPQSLYRTPNGIIEKGFFQKNVESVAPDWAETIELETSKGKKIEYLLCQDQDTLLYMANLGCIEINPWSSSLPDLDKPDFMIFDLDPVEIEFEKVVHLAIKFKELFDQLGLPAYCKTSGSRGLHIYVPIEQNYNYSKVQNFVKILKTHIHKQSKGLTSLERSPSARKGKVYLDYLQNARGKTMASVYSIRPRPGALVSAPLRWEELTPKLKPQEFTIRTMRKRLDKEDDLWKGMFEQRGDLRKALESIEG